MAGKQLRGVGIGVLAACLSGACAARQPARLADSFVQQGEPSISIGDPIELTDELYRPRSATPEPVEITPTAGKVPAAGELEDSDPALATALVKAEAWPTPANHRRVAELYRDHQILDKAFDHLVAAERLAPRDPATQDSLARLWRAWGLQALGLGAAYRAVNFAPESPEAHNTLGTLLQSIGRLADARSAYERALGLDPSVAYVLNNLCYLSFVEGQLDSALESCTAALRLDPTMTEAHNNLALVYLATDQDELAWRELQAGGAVWTALYNLGIAELARGNHIEAAVLFAEASRENPRWAEPRRRAEQALERSHDLTNDR